MNKTLRNVLIVVCCLTVFFVVVPLFNRGQDEDTEAVIYPLFGQQYSDMITDTNHIALLDQKMEFPLPMKDLPEAFHIAKRYYDDMTDGIDAGDSFQCELLNDSDEPVAYIKVTNQKKNTVQSPDDMVITYIVASSFQTQDKQYAVPFVIRDGIGIGSTAEEVKQIFPDADIPENDNYSVVNVDSGIQKITLEFVDRIVYKMAVSSY